MAGPGYEMGILLGDWQVLRKSRRSVMPGDWGVGEIPGVLFVHFHKQVTLPRCPAKAGI